MNKIGTVNAGKKLIYQEIFVRAPVQLQPDRRPKKQTPHLQYIRLTRMAD